jgi:hypothetical protein
MGSGDSVMRRAAELLVVVLSLLGGAPLSRPASAPPPSLARQNPHGLQDLISPRGERVTGLLGGKESNAPEDDL